MAVQLSSTSRGNTPTDPGPDEPSGQRRALEISDLRLSFGAVRWIQSFEINDRPIELALRFPRLANLLSTLWPDPVAAAAALDELLCDRRGGRRGFPDAVRQELLDLRARLPRPG
ncbi:hypothetical protein [Ideonella alba]|uniref:Uncharacterized protein n=1 Tax=Ideonella alba TaxID=2824118 RepID=A0A940YEI9_9BURK|nr:hypothetical protein [Ideonella alba]MBQ0930995.1 hypothetical protein [Ideonella alba]